MTHTLEKPSFQTINRGYNSAFKPNRLSIGLVVPIEAHPHSPVPTLVRHVERVKLAEEVLPTFSK